MSNSEDVNAACTALAAAARENLLPPRAKALALLLRAAFLEQRTRQFELMHVVLQLHETGGKYADADLLARFRKLLEADDNEGNPL